MATDYRSLQRATYQKALEQLARQYEAAFMQSVSAIDATTKVQAEQQAESIEQQIQSIEKKLAQMELSHPEPACADDPGRDPISVHDLLRDRLHKIDFRDVERAIRELLDAEADAGRAGLLLFQRCGEMHGQLCAERIVRILKSETDSGSFRHLPVALRPADRNDPGALIRHLAGYLGLDSAGLPTDRQLGQVTATLCESLQPGSIVLLEFGRCDYLTHEQPAALHWIVTDFWRQLLDDLGPVARRLPGKVTVIALVFFEGVVPDGALAPPLCCSLDHFCRERLLEIELCAWKRAEVEDWLTRWGGLHNRPVQETRLLAETIMAASRGINLVIANQLLDQCVAFGPARAPG